MDAWRSGHPARQLVMAWYDGEVDDGTASELRRHCADCPRCRRWREDLDRVGAAVRGEVVPARRVIPAWGLGPVATRFVPAFAAVAAVVAIVFGFAANDTPRQRGDRTAAGAVSDVVLPPGTGGGRGGNDPGVTPGTTPATSPPAGGEEPGPDGDPGTPGDTSVAAGDPDAPRTYVVGVLVPGGTADPAEPVVTAVARALSDANESGGVDGVPLELVVGDASDPAVVDAMLERGVRVLVGGYGVAPELRAAFAAAGVPWFAPTDTAEAGAGEAVVPVEISHASAGIMVGESARDGGVEDAWVVRGATEEAALADGFGSVVELTGVTEAATGAECPAALEAAAAAEADVVVLALAPADVGLCLDGVSATSPLRSFVVPATAADVALERDLTGVSVTAALGAPPPEGVSEGVKRFRRATGLEGGYRALVSFAGAEVAVHSLRARPDDPYGGFVGEGVYGSDLVTLDPAVVPVNVAPRVVELGAPVGP